MKNYYQVGEYLVAELDEEVPQLVGLFKDVATKLGWNDEGDIARFTSPSIHWGVYGGENLIGGLRLTLPSESGMPYSRVWPEVECHGQIADLALIAFLARQPAPIFWMPCIEMARYCVRNGISTIYSEVPTQRIRTYRKLWGMEEVGEHRSHWGELCALCSTTPERAIQLLKARDGKAGWVKDQLERES